MDTVKLYYDYKSPFAYLASEAGFTLPERYDIEIAWKPYLLRIKGKGERSVYSEWKVRYSYQDARRYANKRGGFKIMGPRKIYDSSPSLIGGLFAGRQGFFRPYTETVFSRFFERRLEIDEATQVADVIEELAGKGAAYLEYAKGEGAVALDASVDEGHEDEIFGVPIFLFRGERFWGHDRIPLLEERLSEAGLAR